MRKSLSRTERLRTSRDIRELFTRATKIDARGLRLLTRGNGGRATRFGVVVARGTGSAVRRNREKRLTREAYRSLKDALPPGRDILFYVTRFGMTFAERRSMMAGLLERAFARGRPGGSKNE